MRYNFFDIEEGSAIVLMLRNGNMQMRMDADLTKFVRDDIAIIDLQVDSPHVLKFDNVKIDMLYTTPRGMPYLWRNVKIVYYKSAYVMQAAIEGHRHNRRNAYRVTVSRTGEIKTIDGRRHKIIIKDLSLSGFSITDRNNHFNFYMGDIATITFEDLGISLNLAGKVVRIDEREAYTIYGFTIFRSCKELPAYITAKQRRKRNGLPPSYVLEDSDK